MKIQAPAVDPAVVIRGCGHSASQFLCAPCCRAAYEALRLAAAGDGDPQIGDVVQLVPGRHVLGGCLMVVERVADDGYLSGYVRDPRQGGSAVYFTAVKGAYVRVGKAAWT